MTSNGHVLQQWKQDCSQMLEALVPIVATECFSKRALTLVVMVCVCVVNKECAVALSLFEMAVSFNKKVLVSQTKWNCLFSLWWTHLQALQQNLWGGVEIQLDDSFILVGTCGHKNLNESWSNFWMQTVNMSVMKLWSNTWLSTQSTRQLYFLWEKVTIKFYRNFCVIIRWNECY